MESIRRIVAFNRVSADGYFAAPDGNLTWAVPDEEVDKAGGEAVPGPENMMLFGRKTYENFESFWPHDLNASPTAPDPHAEGRQSQALRNMALWIDQAVKVVISSTRKTVTWRNSRLLPAFDPRAIDALKREPGRDIMIFGSGTIVSQLTQHALIDEYQFIVSPILLGSGHLLISDVPKSTRLELLEAKKFSSGNVMLRYARQK